jgi:hypothetical protein
MKNALIKYRVILFLVFLICIIFILFYKGLNASSVEKNTIEDGKFTYNDDGSVTLGLGMVANGFHDLDGKINDIGSLLKPTNNIIQGQVSYKQNINDKRNYLLIIMIDYLQHEFIVDDTVYSSYPFSLEGNDEIRINVAVENIDAEAHEYSYFIIPEPDINVLSIDNSNEWNKLLMTSSINWWRLLLDDSEKIEKVEYNEAVINLETQNNYGILLSNNHQEAAAMPSCKSMDEVELIMSNTNNYVVDYALIAFLGWEQVPISKTDMTDYISIPSQSTIYMKLKVPNVEENTPYQIFAIPRPFSNDIRLANPPSTTLRTIISPE